MCRRERRWLSRRDTFAEVPTLDRVRLEMEQADHVVGGHRCSYTSAITTE